MAPDHLGPGIKHLVMWILEMLQTYEFLVQHPVLNRVINKAIISQKRRLKNLLHYTFQSLQNHILKKNPFCCKMTDQSHLIYKQWPLRKYERLGVEARQQTCQQKADTSCILSLQLPGPALRVSLQFVKLSSRDPFICRWEWCVFHSRPLCGAYIYLYFWSAQEKPRKLFPYNFQLWEFFFFLKNFKCQVLVKKSLPW